MQLTALVRPITASACVAAVVLALGPALAAAADADWEAGLERWRAANLAAYEYGYHKFCECHPETPPETVVTVRAGEVVGVRHRPQGSQVDVAAEARNLEFYWTVDGLFELLQSALDREVVVRAQYDVTLGYPTQVYIDYDGEFIGDELDLRVTRVTALR
jgi:hypothetical protein